VIKTAFNVRVEGFFGGVTTWTMSTVVAEGDCFGEGCIQTNRSSDARGNLSYF
jgi:hypothetical protein